MNNLKLTNLILNNKLTEIFEFFYVDKAIYYFIVTINNLKIRASSVSSKTKTISHHNQSQICDRGFGG